MSGLHQAALMCNVPIIQLLLDAGANVDIKDNKGKDLFFSGFVYLFK